MGSCCGHGFGVIAIAVFTFYLQLCVIKGTSSLECAFSFPDASHGAGKTMANSFSSISGSSSSAPARVQFAVDFFESMRSRC